MAERRSGPIKPPTLDLKAREAEKKAHAAAKTDSASAPKTPAAETSEPSDQSQSPTSETTAASEPTPKPSETAPKKDADTDMTQSDSIALTPFIASTAIGAVLGLVLAYGLALAGYWPTMPDSDKAAFEAIDGINQDLANLQNELMARIATLESQVETLPIETDTGAIDSMKTGIARLQDRLDALPENAAAGPVDLTPLSDEIAAQTIRIDALEANTNGDGKADGLNDLSSRISTNETDARQNATQLQALTGRMAAIEAELTAEPAQAQSATSVMRVPLALSSLETAIANGRSFATEITALASALPQLDIPQSLMASANAGLTRPEVLGEQLHHVVPKMLAAKPPIDGTWTQRTMSRLKALFAVRPKGDGDSNKTTPEALVAHLESSVERRDFDAADQVMQALPQPMQVAAGSVVDDIAAYAEATRFAESARQFALQSAETQE